MSDLQVKKFSNISGNDEIVLADSNLTTSVNKVSPTNDGNINLCVLASDDNNNAYIRYSNKNINKINLNRTLVYNGKFEDILIANDIVIAYYQNDIITSDDGIEYSILSKNGLSGDINQIIWDGNRYFSCTTKGLYISSDLVNWTIIGNLTEEFETIAYNEKLGFYLAGSVNNVYKIVIGSNNNITVHRINGKASGKITSVGNYFFMTRFKLNDSDSFTSFALTNDGLTYNTAPFYSKVFELVPNISDNIINLLRYSYANGVYIFSYYCNSPWDCSFIINKNGDVIYLGKPYVFTKPDVTYCDGVFYVQANSMNYLGKTSRFLLYSYDGISFFNTLSESTDPLYEPFFRFKNIYLTKYYGYHNGMTSEYNFIYKYDPINSVIATKEDIPQLPSFSDVSTLPDETYTIDDLKEKINLILTKFGAQSN